MAGGPMSGKKDPNVKLEPYTDPSNVANSAGPNYRPANGGVKEHKSETGPMHK